MTTRLPRFNGQQFYEAWHWLHEHPAFSAKGRHGPKYPQSLFSNDCLEIDVARVDPTTGQIEDDKSRNTLTEVWLECGPVEDPTEADIASGHWTEQQIDYGRASHDYNLDCGAPTFEEAILQMANLVVEFYGDHPPLLEQIAEAAK